ncbi:TetR family transcriptional regulator [Sediminihabitans luteus]|uniref:TetR family transcriptional regulator n=1 Tax=Sediminihabitans luteus TaxID=1138585 RepID=A0A2M9D163_9CELL|nr:TetR/AcrR family transcriptional regulator [Sediminihabitans luteus]PJJ77825.1 TetR family transcriptional regulator [Sediminihabitans luteus]GII99817.1 TetR family transcriptional regulator [Sediminihabitans luteus]
MTGTTRPSDVRTRILDAATRQFYADGVRAVSADRIIAAAEVSKVTFYRHFRSKDDLVVAYLEAWATRERDALDGLRASHPDDAATTLREIAGFAGEMVCRPDFRGCAFINAAAEYPDAEHPVRRVVAAHRAWWVETLASLVRELGVDDPPAAAEELMMLRDGAMVAGYVGEGAGLAERVTRVGTAIVRAHR